VRQRKDATSRRFLVQRQGYLRNSRRILEIGSQAVLVLDLNLTVRTRLEIADIMSVKVGADETSCTLQMRKGGETFVCSHRAELLSTLLPIIQGDVGGLIFSLLKWSKRMIAGIDEPGSRAPVRFRVWSGKLAVVQEDVALCASEIHMHTIARILPLSDNRSGLVIQLKYARGGGAVAAGRLLRFTVGDAGENSHVNFSARDRLVRALADSALAQLGVSLPVEEITEQQCKDMFTSLNAMPADFIESFAVQRISAEKVKARTVDVTSWGIIERDDSHLQLIHHSIQWCRLTHIVRLPGTLAYGISRKKEKDAHVWEPVSGADGAGVGWGGGGGGGPEGSGGREGNARKESGARVALCSSDGRVHIYASDERWHAAYLLLTQYLMYC
jgi:uncharacterized protein YcgL (UPF0745 family)